MGSCSDICPPSQRGRGASARALCPMKKAAFADALAAFLQRFRPGCPISETSPKRLTLRELLPAACLVEADLLTFDFTCITRHEASVRQSRLQRCVVVHQRAGDAVANRTGLTRFTAARDVHLDVERYSVVREFQRLAHDHQRGFAREVVGDGLAVHNDVALACLDEDTSDGALAAARTVVPVTDHVGSP